MLRSLTTKRLGALTIVFAFWCSAVIGQSPSGPLTRPERTNFQETSRYDDVMQFLQEVAKVSPAVHLTSFGRTVEGRELPLAVIGAPAPTPEAVRATRKLRVYIQANIHAGEVEGKESAQMLVRDLAQGKHKEWLQSMVLLVAPIYNADGNERISLTNRGRQHGPLAGQGQRPNAQGLDLNRDHMKLDSPEARAVVTLMNDYDPHVSMDLHTTNGTRHAYYLTYAPPLNPATDRSIIDLLRERWLPSVTRAIKTKFGWDYYYYGNVDGTSDVAGAPDERRWASFDHRPRFNNNYIGLRNRTAILSEAYAYATFEDRIKATSRFVDETLAYAQRHAKAIKDVTAIADRRKVVGSRLALRAALERAPQPVEILLGEVIEEKHPKDGHVMHRRADVIKPERMAEYGTFRATETERVPAAYYVPAWLGEALDRLRAHGIRLTEVRREVRIRVEEFSITSTDLAPEPFQNHRERTVTGAWKTARRVIAPGSFRVDMTQPLARLAFYLIEPRSDDGLVNWNLVDDALKDVNVYPIVRTLE